MGEEILTNAIGMHLIPMGLVYLQGLSIGEKIKVQTLLLQAEKCKTNADAEKLLDTLERVFGNARPLSHLYKANSDYYMEGDKPSVSFELNQEISEHYITMIRPEIREGKLVVCVTTQHMLDGMGMSSKSWETIDGMEDVIEAGKWRTVADLAKQAKELAIANHSQLIERVGVPTKVARKAAKQSW